MGNEATPDNGRLGRVCGVRWSTELGSSDERLDHRCISTEHGKHIHVCPCGAVDLEEGAAVNEQADAR